MVPAVVTSETASAERGGGRPFGEIKEDMIAWIRAVHEESKANPLPYLAPSLNAIAAQAKRRYPEGELWSRARAKVHRALALGSEADPGDHEALAYRREAVSG